MDFKNGHRWRSAWWRATRSGDHSGGGGAVKARSRARLKTGSSPLFRFHSLRAFRRSEIIHTPTLGQALMPAGLPVEGRIMRHACGPRRAWLNNH